MKRGPIFTAALFFAAPVLAQTNALPTPGLPLPPLQQAPSASPAPSAPPSASPSAAPSAAPSTSPGAMPLPEGWGASPVPNINLVGKWSFQANSEGIPEDGILVFQASGVYNEFLRFPQTPQLGNQVVQVWGNYTVQGATLTERPTGGQVSNGPNPNEICNLQTNQCVALNLTPQTEQLQVVDANTIKTSTATAKRIQ